MAVKSHEEAERQTAQCFEKLRGYIGEIITVEKGEYTFCTEEDHNPHFWPLSERERYLFLLEEVDIDRLMLVGRTTTQDHIHIPFFSQGQSGQGYYNSWYITKISLGDLLLFTIKVEKNKRPGFMGEFYFYLEECVSSS